MKLAEYRALVKRAKKRKQGTGNGGQETVVIDNPHPRSPIPGPHSPAKKSPNATESAFNREILGGKGVFEGMSFRIAGGHRYTPDFIVQTPQGGIEAYEVKGSYRFPSEGRARLAFDDARERFPAIRFFWYRMQSKTKGTDKAKWKDET